MKFTFDKIASFFGLIILLPIFIVVFILIKIKMPNGPAIFTQKRVGKNGKLFTIYKFRTMTNELDKNGILLPDERRLTKFGKFLRSTSLDELPSLSSVLNGDMSLVGPRPLLEEYLPFYSERQARRHEVRPGITGWAQVNGRNAISWEEKFELDLWYIENQSLWLDIKILCLTMKKVLIRDGISPHGEDIMPRFDTIMIGRRTTNEK